MLEIEFDWPDWSEAEIEQSEPQLLCTYVNNTQVQTLVFSAAGFQQVMADSAGGLLWGAWVVPEWAESLCNTVETEMRNQITALQARARTDDEFYQSLELLGAVEDSPRGKLLLSASDLPFLWRS